MNYKESIEKTKQGFEASFQADAFYNKQTKDEKHLELILNFLKVSEFYIGLSNFFSFRLYIFLILFLSYFSKKSPTSKIFTYPTPKQKPKLKLKQPNKNQNLNLN